MSNPTTVFYSWQSDHPNRLNRGFIADALDRAIKRLQRDETIVEAERPDLQRDSDTQGVPGSPDIAATILQKIDECAVFIADISTIGQAGPKDRSTPNPNVLFELGYAWHTLTSAKILLVSNTAFCSYPEHPEQDMPFDLRGKRLITYSPRDGEEKASARERLVSGLVTALREMLPSLRTLPPRPPVDWRAWLSADVGGIYFQQVFALDWDRDGQPEPVVVVGTECSDGRSMLHLMVFRFLAGGWSRVRVAPIEGSGSLLLCGVEMHQLTDKFWPDFVVRWNGGGSGSSMAIFRGNSFSYELTQRQHQGLSAPLGMSSRVWVSHYRHQQFFQTINGTWQEEIAEYLLFDLNHAWKALDVAPLLANQPTPPDHSVWVQRIWRWNDQERQFTLASQVLSAGPPKD